MASAKINYSSLSKEDLQEFNETLVGIGDHFQKYGTDDAQNILMTLCKSYEGNGVLESIAKALSTLSADPSDIKTKKVNAWLNVLQKKTTDDIGHLFSNNLQPFLKEFPQDKVFFEAKRNGKQSEDFFFVSKDLVILSDGTGYDDPDFHNPFAQDVVTYFSKNSERIIDEESIKQLLSEVKMSIKPYNAMQLGTLIIVKKYSDHNVIFNIGDSNIFIDGKCCLNDKSMTHPIWFINKAPGISNNTTIGIMKTTSNNIIITTDGATDEYEANLKRKLSQQPNLPFESIKGLLNNFKSSDGYGDDVTIVDLRP